MFGPAARLRPGLVTRYNLVRRTNLGLPASFGAERPAPFLLVNGKYFYLYNLQGLRRKQRFLATLEYRYVYQMGRSICRPAPPNWRARHDRSDRSSLDLGA
jgi:hypothetical protein